MGRRLKRLLIPRIGIRESSVFRYFLLLPLTIDYYNREEEEKNRVR